MRKVFCIKNTSEKMYCAKKNIWRIFPQLVQFDPPNGQLILLVLSQSLITFLCLLCIYRDLPSNRISMFRKLFLGSASPKGKTNFVITFSRKILVLSHSHAAKYPWKYKYQLKNLFCKKIFSVVTDYSLQEIYENF